MALDNFQHKPGDVVGEVFSLENSRGDILEFNQAVYIPNFNGFGTAPINYLTTKSYQQDGSTLLDLTLGERIIILDIYHESQDSREAWWDLRKELVDFLRPELDSPLVLTITQAGGEQFSIDVYADPGILFENTDTNERDINESLSFRAFNPVWRKTSTITLSPEATQDVNLVFPIIFPILFGSSGTVFTSGALNYLGSWKSYPTITLTGPYTTATVLLVNKNIQFQLLTSILAGQQRIITTLPSNLSIVDGSGNSKFDELSLPSNLRDFFIPPAPDGETEEIRITFVGGTVGVSQGTIAYNENYLGI